MTLIFYTLNMEDDADAEDWVAQSETCSMPSAVHPTFIAMFGVLIASEVFAAVV